ncbi:alpha/beta hydrolase [Pedobacter sp. MC2016-24]|uniref:alpha/beta hydrolase n=1 Tax=Pedobacter sp. MC2016-24 TaxID=2780090 RepID=UPI001882426B|nr:alpha/beta hydrolase-fold protein [Pedobacter sp. MC2016-24]MBE9602390.1 alpha/beta hydrolase [Pedobacter sp. MC2016-24]
MSRYLYILILLVLPWFTRAQVKPTRSPNVQVIDTAFKMPQLNKQRRIWIYLPQGYAASAKKYPVLYMHDGQNVFDAKTSAYGEWNVDEILDSLYQTNIQQAIVVGIDHGGEDRLKEYNPYDSKYGKGAGKAYVAFLVETLKPYIDAHYRTLRDAKHTSIAGSSMGGLISMYALARYPKVFGNAGVFSAAFWIAPEVYKEVAALLPKGTKAKVYFVTGGMEGGSMSTDMEQMYQLLNPKGKLKNIRMLEPADGKHSEWFWHREFPEFYKFIFQP